MTVTRLCRAAIALTLLAANSIAGSYLEAEDQFPPAYAPVISEPGAVETLQDPDSLTADTGEESQAWWDSGVRVSMQEGRRSHVVSVEDLLVRALEHSSQIKVFSELPLIRETSIVEASAAFDWVRFLDTRWDDTSEPVGNSLTVGGGGTRFRDNNLTAGAGLRRRNQYGGQFQIAQRIGFQNNNSTFFTPNDQGTSRLVLSYSQPLKRGRGEVYNNSLIVLAQIDAKIANDEFRRQLQSHLLEVVRAYWGLYLERGIYLQQARSYERAQEVFDRLRQRSEIDTYQSQLISAEAEVKTRGSDLRRAMAAVKNAEDRIRALVNDPELNQGDLELVPVESPTSEIFPVTMEEALTTAVQFRPEINQALKQIKAACVRVNMSKNEMLPILNLVTETYLAGLRDDFDVGGAWVDQFSRGEPSYAIGLEYEAPFCNRAARARNTRRSLELRQLKNQYTTTVQTLKLETRVAVREVQTSYDELDTKKSAMNAMKAKTAYILRRWELMPGEGRSGNYVLEDLLASQAQLSRAENDYLKSVVTYNLSLMNLKRATGMLLQHENVEIGRTQMNCLPSQILDKPRSEPAPAQQMIETVNQPASAPGQETTAAVGSTRPAEDQQQPVVRSALSKLRERFRR